MKNFKRKPEKHFSLYDCRLKSIIRGFEKIAHDSLLKPKDIKCHLQFTPRLDRTNYKFTEILINFDSGNIRKKSNSNHIWLFNELTLVKSKHSTLKDVLNTLRKIKRKYGGNIDVIFTPTFEGLPQFYNRLEYYFFDNKFVIGYIGEYLTQKDLK